jgi:tRNA A37 threonylcarbamoyladenosine biosynthesis protein TsaE
VSERVFERANSRTRSFAHWCPREFDELGLDEIAEDGVLAIEWADKYPRPPARAVRVSIAHAGESERSVTVESTKYEV